MLVAIHLVFGQSHDCGIRSMGWFLELSELDCFIASSYGAQQKFASQVEHLIGQFGEQEDRRLGQLMPKRSITLCEDETFHPQICSVSIEPVSNSLALNRQVEKAKVDHEVAITAHLESLDKSRAFDKTYPCTIRELECEKALNQNALELQKVCQETRERFEATTDRKQRARKARCGIANDYHPFELKTGKPMESGDVQNRLNEHFKKLHSIAEDAKLSQSAHDRIAKAQRVLPSMIATIVFFWCTIKLFGERLGCRGQDRQTVHLARCQNRFG